MIRLGLPSSATPTGARPDETRASTKEYSSATTRLGLPVMVVVPRSCLIVRVGLPHWSRLRSELTPGAAAARSALGAAPAAGDAEVPPQAEAVTAAAVRTSPVRAYRSREVEGNMASLLESMMPERGVGAL